jgi:hypothetical protein
LAFRLKSLGMAGCLNRQEAGAASQQAPASSALRLGRIAVELGLDAAERGHVAGFDE